MKKYSKDHLRHDGGLRYAIKTLATIGSPKLLSNWPILIEDTPK